MATLTASATALVSAIDAAIAALPLAHSVSSGDVTTLAALHTQAQALADSVVRIGGVDAGEIEGFAIRGNKAISLVG